METRLTLRPGQPGTKKLLERYGTCLVCVRYVYDEERGIRRKTVELIVEEVPWRGKPRKARRNDRDLVAVRIGWDEQQLRASVTQAGGIWRPRQRVWEISWEAVRTLGMQSRVVQSRVATESPR